MTPPPKPSRPISEEDLLANAIPIEAVESQGQAADEPQPLELAGEDKSGLSDTGGSTRVRVFSGPPSSAPEQRWKRRSKLTGEGAVHVKTFVAKLRLDAIEHLDEQINDWLDQHPDYEVKFVTTAVGSLIGKVTEDALFVNVWV